MKNRRSPALFAVFVILLLMGAISPFGFPPHAQQNPERQAGAAATQAVRTQTAAEAPTDVPSTPLPADARPERELSPWSMFLAADGLVKAVMLSLAFASLVTWTIFLAMSIHIALVRRKLVRMLTSVADSGTLAEAQIVLRAGDGVLPSLLMAAGQELRLSVDSFAEVGVRERVAMRFSEIVRAEAHSVRQGMGVLATIGATAPFVGLFGTVWGIMNSFIGISKLQTTNLAVVAPGIAEALLATAAGLVAAIPAVIIYNHLTRATRGYLDLVGRATGAVGRLLSRDLDRTYCRPASRAAE